MADRLPKCPKCGYQFTSLTGSGAPVLCPKCGARL